jgi:hypothetical protein
MVTPASLLGRDRRGSFVDGSDAPIEPLPEPANLSVDAVAQVAKGSQGQFLKPFNDWPSSCRRPRAWSSTAALATRFRP